MIKLKCDYSSGAVAVPTEIIDKHLKLAPSASFKVLLFLLRNPHSVEDAEQIAICTGLSVNDVKDCLSYWDNYNVLDIDENTVSNKVKEETIANAKILKTNSEENQAENEVKKEAFKKLPVKKPTQKDIAIRISQEPELSIVYREAQNILGTFGYDTQSLILMIYDFYGFPPEVIITLLQYQKNQNKISSSAIKSRAEDWAKRGIDSLDLVEEELLSLEKIDKIYIEIKESAGLTQALPSPRIAKYLREWAVNWNCSNELILYALTESQNTFSDANKLLKKWKNIGIKTPKEVEENKKKSIPKEVKKSYDTNNIGRNSVLDWMKKYSDGEENK